jgi:5-methylcytosine-specific restriction endonuclease McrA
MRYCCYCGRVEHRCDCAKPTSALQAFLAVIGADYAPSYRETPYKRGVPPQVKRRERAILKRHYANWKAQVSMRDGLYCAHCGVTDALVLDHVLPIARGGTSTPENLQLLCARCNRLKGKLVFVGQLPARG